VGKTEAGTTLYILKVEKSVDARREEIIESGPLDQSIVKPWFLVIIGMGTINLSISGFVFRVTVKN
jgi:hypothetical protein